VWMIASRWFDMEGVWVVSRRNADIALLHVRDVFWLSMGYNFGYVIASCMIFDSRGAFSGWSYPMKILRFWRTLPWQPFLGFLYVGCALAPPGEYKWSVHVRRWCGLIMNYFDHLLCFVTVGWTSGRALDLEKESAKRLSVCGLQWTTLNGENQQTWQNVCPILNQDKPRLHLVRLWLEL